MTENDKTEDEMEGSSSFSLWTVKKQVDYIPSIVNKTNAIAKS